MFGCAVEIQHEIICVYNPRQGWKRRVAVRLDMAVWVPITLFFTLYVKKRNIMCNLFPKTRFSIQQHSGNKLGFFSLKVDCNSLSACVWLIKGFWAVYRKMFNKIQFCSRSKIDSTGECELSFMSLGVIMASWLRF